MKQHRHKWLQAADTGFGIIAKTRKGISFFVACEYCPGCRMIRLPLLPKKRKVKNGRTKQAGKG